jgi:photosystem I P700 chlorophyll a apoprotein A2
MCIIICLLFAGWLHLQPKFRQVYHGFKNNESFKPSFIWIMGLDSLAWTGHLVHVAIPASRGVHIGWVIFNNSTTSCWFSTVYTGNWTAYAENQIVLTHVYGTSEGAGTAILTFLGGFHPQTQSLWLSDIAHHQLAISLFSLLQVTCIEQTSVSDNERDLDAHRPPGGRLRRSC